MKKLFLLFIFISGFAFGQFTITESSNDWKFVGKLYSHISLHKTDNMAKFIYKDQIANYDDYQFAFSVEPNTLKEIYSIIKDHFKEKKVEKLTLEFPEGRIYLNFWKPMGSYTLQLEFDNTSGNLDKNSTLTRQSYPLSLKSVDKLFGVKN